MINSILQGNNIETLKSIPSNYVNCCITSPPYYGLRNYNAEGQIGIEETPEMYIEKLISVFNEVKRILRNDGTLWVNIGDSYAGSGKGGQSENKKSKNWQPVYSNHGATYGLKPKDLIGIPWMLAFALRENGWYLRQDIIWNKPNPMPEPVTDRCVKAHEYLFLLSKSKKYFFDSKAIQEPAIYAFDNRGERGDNRRGTECNSVNGATGEYRNKRDVWTVTTEPLGVAHFAIYPQKLILPCVLCACPENGIILDPFMGSGTTAVVAVKNLRNYIGCELNPDYIKIAETRIQNEKGLFDTMPEIPPPRYYSGVIIIFYRRRYAN